jgi:hypothetical protein
MFGTKTMINLNEAKQILEHYIKTSPEGGETPVLFEAYLPQHFKVSPKEFQKVLDKIDPYAGIFDYVAHRISKETSNITGEK